LIEIITLQIEIPWFWMVLEDNLQISDMDWAILSVGHEHHSANQCPQKPKNLKSCLKIFSQECKIIS
jgi:hypothetical protein